MNLREVGGLKKPRPRSAFACNRTEDSPALTNFDKRLPVSREIAGCYRSSVSHRKRTSDGNVRSESFSVKYRHQPCVPPRTRINRQVPPAL